ncbi:four helix bundle protein [Candidatus Uhrbacteria bacterium]|nr:four helix bundle protein [Candidatus Uhrbacteria bacterium]
MKVQSFQDLIVWKKGIELVLAIYELTSHFPREEVFGLASQMKRAAVSIPSNIAEGSMRGTRKDYRHFLYISYGSGAELQTQIAVVKKLPFGVNLQYNDVDTILIEVMKILNTLITKLGNKPDTCNLTPAT